MSLAHEQLERVGPDLLKTSTCPRIVRWLLYAVWMVAPLSATTVLVEELKLFDLLSLLALALISVLVPANRNSSLYLPRPSRRLLLGIAVLCAGLAVGGVRGGVEEVDLARIAAYGVAAGLPVVLLLRCRAV